MKFYLTILCLLGFINVFAQPNEETTLRYEEQFELSFTFQPQGQEAFTVIFSRETNTDNIKIGSSSCQNDINHKRPIANKVAYEQMLDYLHDINITVFQPVSNGDDANAKLEVKGVVNVERTWTMNAFVFQYNPDNEVAENKILDFIIKILNENASDECCKKLAEELNKYAG